MGCVRGYWLVQGLALKTKVLWSLEEITRQFRRKRGTKKPKGEESFFTTKDAKKVRRGGRLIKLCVNIGRALWQPGRR